MRPRSNLQADEPSGDGVIACEFGPADVPGLLPAPDRAAAGLAQQDPVTQEPTQSPRMVGQKRKIGACATALVLVAAGGIAYRSATEPHIAPPRTEQTADARQS